MLVPNICPAVWIFVLSLVDDVFRGALPTSPHVEEVLSLRMGYDVSRFEGEVDEELVCPICSAVLEDPRLAPECEHAYCAGKLANNS